MMTQGDYRAAVDIGTTKVSVIVANRRADRRIELTGLGSAPCDAIQRGSISNPRAIIEAVRAATAQAAQAAGVSIHGAYVGLSGSQIQSESRSSHVPRRAGVRTVTEEDLELARNSAATVAPVAGRQTLHVMPRSYTLDGVHGVHNPQGMHASEMHVQSQVITGPVNLIEALEGAVRAAGLHPAGMIVEPMATAEAVFTNEERYGVTVLADIGGTRTNVAVFVDGVMVYTTDLPIGGYQFTNDLSIGFSLPYADAEELKLKQGTVAIDVSGHAQEIIIYPTGMNGPAHITQRDVGKLLRDRAEELMQMMQIKLDVPELAGMQLDRYVFTGGGSRLSGLAQLAKHLYQLKVRVGVPKGLDGLPEAGSDPSLSAPLGILVWAFRNLPAQNHVTRARQGANGGVLTYLKDFLPVWRHASNGNTATKV